MTRYVDGSVLSGSNIREGLEGASRQLVAEGYPEITVVDGDRDYDDQVRIFKARYVPSSEVGGRFVYDRRWWEGQWWSRISSAGTVAAPSRQAPHVAKIAADIGWPYNNRSTRAHQRLQQIASSYGLAWTGQNFGEDWHWETTRGVGRIGAPASDDVTPFTPAPAATPVPEEDEDMPTHIKSSIGESLAFGSLVVRFPTPDDVAATKITAGPALQVLETTAAVHTSLIATAERQDAKAAALPIVVYADGGDGTVYVWEDGRLRALADPATLHDLLDRGATVVHWSAAEVASLLAQQSA